MCGIFGFCGESRDGPLGLALIRRRGPDRLAYWDDPQERVWLGHARLSIQDLSPAGNQPMVDPSGRFVMVYNGEIYNSPDLRTDLEAAGETFVGHSDTEVLLRLFSQEGTACFAKLNGIFAAAIWDRQDQTLTLVRDAVGVKPLYIDRRGGGIAFASEMKSLLRTHSEPPYVRRSATLRHIVYLWSPGHETIAEGVDKLLPGQFLVRDASGHETLGTFADWSLPSGATSELGLEAAAQKLARLVDQGVRRQMLADVPVGAFLSGGLDSSAVVAFASKMEAGRNRLQCFTISITGDTAVEAGFVEDLPYAKKVAEHLGVDLNVVEVGADMSDRLEELLYLLDEPNADPAPLNALAIAELARARGITVLLSGTGGDDVLTGYRRHYALQQERWWSWLPQGFRRLLRGATTRLPRKNPLARRIAKAFENAHLSADDRLLGYFNWLDPARAARLVRQDEVTPADAREIAEPLRESLARAGGRSCSLDRLLYLERRHFLADHNLMYTDKTGMAAGVEVRVPLLDPDVIAFADTLPVNYRLRGRVGKWIFKRAMEPYLPRDVIYRGKTGFGAPLRDWLAGPLRPMLDSALSAGSLQARGLFDSSEVAQLVDDMRLGRVDATYSVFAILCIELWCRQFIDGHYAVDRELDVKKVPMHCVS